MEIYFCSLNAALVLPTSARESQHSRRQPCKECYSLGMVFVFYPGSTGNHTSFSDNLQGRIFCVIRRNSRLFSVRLRAGTRVTCLTRSQSKALRYELSFLINKISTFIMSIASVWSIRGYTAGGALPSKCLYSHSGRVMRQG